jgi:putative transposase
LQEHLPLQAGGYKASAEDLFNVLLSVAVNRDTLETVCADLEIDLSAETLRGYYKAQLRREGLPQLEQALNQALQAELPKVLWKKAQKMAIDLHDRPYYGKQPQADGLWVTGQLRAGTNRVYRVATAYVIRDGLRLNLAIHFVQPHETALQILQALLERLQKMQLKMARLFLDKGFDGIEELAYLQDQDIPAVVACTIRGKTGGTKALCRGRKSYRTPYTFKGRKREFSAQLAVCRVFTTNKRTGRMKRKASWMIFVLIHCDLTPQQAKQQYRYRFGIETSYRCAGKVRGWTTSPNPAYRFLLIGLAFFLVNVWVHLRWLLSHPTGRGRRKTDFKCFRLSRLAKFIRRALERFYGCAHQISTPDPPLP